MYTQIVTYHEVAEFINSMPDSFKIACGPCACRINTAEELGPDAMDIEAGKFEFINQTPLNVDIQFGACGEQFGKLESYKDITKRELLELEKECHNLGLVSNIYVMLNGEGSICHCSSKTCVPLTVNSCISGNGHFIKRGELVAKTNPSLCNNTGYCTKVCHFNARRMIDENGKIILQYDQAKCYGCGLCESVCPEKAVKMIKRKERVGQAELSCKQG
jgi:NAD-dependent dihydropyrimidine dehydrogenase PreA subunit